MLSGVYYRMFTTVATALTVVSGAANASTYVSLHSFSGGKDGSEPRGSLLEVGGLLYGTTSVAGNGMVCKGGCGEVFSFDPQTGRKTLLHAFTGTDGSQPSAGLIDVGGTLYGTTVFGGAFGWGTVFAVNPATGSESVVYSFEMAHGGIKPLANLLDVGGKLYGTASEGGYHSSLCSFGCGAVFAVDPVNNTEKTLYKFKITPDLGGSVADLIESGSLLYGTTTTVTQSACETSGCGTIFSVNPQTGVKATVFTFPSPGNNGALPGAGLLDVSGVLYGTTASGGAHNAGTVFSFNPATRVQTVVYSFKAGSDGATPAADLIDVGGILYGTTFRGGAADFGTVFALNPTSGNEQVLHAFSSGTDGAYPTAGLIDVGGTLYGTTYQGGATNQGTLFAVTP